MNREKAVTFEDVDTQPLELGSVAVGDVIQVGFAVTEVVKKRRLSFLRRPQKRVGELLEPPIRGEVRITPSITEQQLQTQKEAREHGAEVRYQNNDTYVLRPEDPSMPLHVIDLEVTKEDRHFGYKAVAVFALAHGNVQVATA